MRFLLSLSLLLSVSVAQAVEVSDPRGELGRLSNYIESVPFEQAFSCSSSTEYSANTLNCVTHCQNGICRGECHNPNTPTGRLKIKLYVEDCTADSVSVYGDNGLSIQITKEDYIKGGNTVIIPFLKSIGHFMQPEGDITVGMLMPMGMYEYVHDGVREKIRGVSVFADIHGGTPQANGFEIVLAAKGQGLSQILLMRDGMDEFLRLKGVFDVKH